MLRNTKCSAIAVAAAMILIGSHADAQNLWNKSRNPVKNNSPTVTFPSNNCSGDRGFTVTNSTATAGTNQRKYQNRFDNVRSRKQNIQRPLRSQRDELNRFGVAGRNAFFENSRGNSCPSGPAFVPQVPTPATRTRPRLIPNEFIVGLSNKSKSANLFRARQRATGNPDAAGQVSGGQSIANPFYSILVYEE